jgi:integrase
MKARKRGNVWEARARIHGKQASFWGATEEEAIQQAKAQQFRAGLTDLTRLSETISFEQFIVGQVVPLFASLSRDSINKAGWAFERIARKLGRIPVRDLTPGIILSFLASEVEDLNRNYWSVHAVRAHLSRALTLASRMELIRYNYAEGWRNPCRPTRKIHAQPRDAMSWCLSLEGHWSEPWYFCCLALGCGRSEPLEITLDCIGEDSVFVPGTKNEYRERTVYPGEAIMARIRGYSWGKKRRLVEVPGSARRPSEDWHGFQERGMPTPHSLRHTFGAIESTLGCPASVRMAIMGQSMTSNVSTNYVHPTPDAQEMWLTKWAALLGLDQVSTEIPSLPEGTREGESRVIR